VPQIENMADHRWLAQDILTDGPIQNIAYYLGLIGSAGAFPLTDKGGQVFNVKAYGATGLGNPAIDTPGVQLAITTAQAAGGGTV
jgi:hypothetical protein